LHALVVSLIYSLHGWACCATDTAESPTKDTTITYYKLSEYLPAITSASAPAKEGASWGARGDASPIVSVPKMPDNLEQTIVDPNNIAVIHQHVDVPNMVVMTPSPRLYSRQPGIPKLVLRRVQVVAPAAETVTNSLAQMKLPKLPDPQVIQPAPDVANMKMKLSDLTIANSSQLCPSPGHSTPARALPAGHEGIVRARFY